MKPPKEFIGFGPSKSVAEADSYRQLWEVIRPDMEDEDNQSWIHLAKFLREMVEGDFPMLERYPGLVRYVFIDDAQSGARLASDFKEGGFNPYGNGQTSVSKKQFLASHKVKYDQLGLTAVQRTARWMDYSRSGTAKKKQKKTTTSPS